MRNVKWRILDRISANIFFKTWNVRSENIYFFKIWNIYFSRWESQIWNIFFQDENRRSEKMFLKNIFFQDVKCENWKYISSKSRIADLKSCSPKYISSRSEIYIFQDENLRSEMWELKIYFSRWESQIWKSEITYLKILFCKYIFFQIWNIFLQDVKSENLVLENIYISRCEMWDLKI